MISRRLVIDVTHRPDQVRAQLRRELADIDRASEFFATVLPFLGPEGPAPDLVGTVDATTFRLRVVWPWSWFKRRGPVEILGVVTSTPDGSRIVVTFRRPWWFGALYLAMSAFILSLFGMVLVERDTGAIVALTLIVGVGGLVGVMRHIGDMSEAETALRKVLQPEGKGRFAWD